MSTNRTVVALLALCLFTAFSSSPLLAADNLKIGSAAGAPVENIFKPIQAAFEKKSGIALQVDPAGAQAALSSLLKGDAEAATAGVSFEEWLALMKKDGIDVGDPAALVPTVIGIDRIVVMVNKANPIKELSKDQLKAIFTGKAENWKDFGGSDSPIIVVWGTATTGTNLVFQKKALDGEAILKDPMLAAKASDIKNVVVSTPEAIGIGPVSMGDDKVGLPKIPVVDRPITLVTKGAPSARVKTLIDFIAGEGQSLVKK